MVGTSEQGLIISCPTHNIFTWYHTCVVAAHSSPIACSILLVVCVSVSPPPRRREDVINVEQARIAEEAGAVAVMALERIPADIRVDGGVARMSDPKMIREIKAAVSIPVMAKVCTWCLYMYSKNCSLSLFFFFFFFIARMLDSAGFWRHALILQ